MENQLNCAFEGDITLMVSEHSFNKRKFTDRKNKALIIMENALENKSIIMRKMSNVENSIRKDAPPKTCQKLRIYFK